MQDCFLLTVQSDKPHILLVNPWIHDFAAYDVWAKPIGLLILAAILRKNGYDISYIDCLDRFHPRGAQTDPYARNGRGPYLKKRIRRPDGLEDVARHYCRYGIKESWFREDLTKIKKPDLIMVTSMMTYWYPGVFNTIRIIKEIFPGIPLILGGIYASLCFRHAKMFSGADQVITGPCEQQILGTIAEEIGDGEGGGYGPLHIDDYPYPAFDLIPDLRYLCIMTSRGCPLNCSFCAQKHIAAKFSQRQPEAVVDEIVYHYKKYKIQDFAFYDDALFMNKENHIMVILRLLINAKLPIRLHTPNGLFARDIDAELAELMYQANFKTIRLSFETSNENRRKDMYNKISNEGMISAVRNLTEAGYSSSELDAYVIMGLPDQSMDEILESIIFVNNLGVQVKLASFSPIPKTRDFERAVESGKIMSDIDPLLTNKTIFPLKGPELDYNTFRSLRTFSHLLNDAAKKDMAPFADNMIGNGLKRILRESP